MSTVQLPESLFHVRCPATWISVSCKVSSYLNLCFMSGVQLPESLFIIRCTATWISVSCQVSSYLNLCFMSGVQLPESLYHVRCPATWISVSCLLRMSWSRRSMVTIQPTGTQLSPHLTNCKSKDVYKCRPSFGLPLDEREKFLLFTKRWLLTRQVSTVIGDIEIYCLKMSHIIL